MPYGDAWGTDKGGYEDIGFHIQTSEWVAPEGNWRDYTWRASGEVTDPDNGTVLTESYTMIIALGRDWISDDGETVVNTRKDTARFPANGKMGRIIEGLVKLDDEGKIDLNQVGNPRLASSYVGLKLRWQRHEFPYKGFTNRETGETVEAGVSDQLIPVAVMEGSKGGTGKADGVVASQISGTTTPEPVDLAGLFADQPEAPGVHSHAPEAGGLGGSATLEADLIGFAQTFSDKDEFIAAALGDPELATDAHFTRSDEVLADRALVRKLMKHEIWDEATKTKA